MSEAKKPIDTLIDVMSALRAPDTGCPWDREQTFSTIAPYTVEEAYEVADAIARDDMTDLREELGDLLLQVVFHAQMAKELGLFTFDDVATSISDKLIYRHPHVFGDDTAATSADVIPLWNARKDAENKKKGKKGSLCDEGKGLPALIRGQKIRRKMPDTVKESNDALLTQLKQTAQTADLTADKLVDMVWIITQILEDKSVDLETSLQAHINKKVS